MDQANERQQKITVSWLILENAAAHDTSLNKKHESRTGNLFTSWLVVGLSFSLFQAKSQAQAIPKSGATTPSLKEKQSYEPFSLHTLQDAQRTKHRRQGND